MEARSRPRAPAPAPKEGALPLPADLVRERLDFAPARIEDLNEIVPEGVPRLATPQDHPNVCSRCNGFKGEVYGTFWS